MKTSTANLPKKAPQSHGMSSMLRRLAARRVAQAMTAGALIALGAQSASAQTTFSLGKSVLTSTDPVNATALGAIVDNTGATVEFIGPATIGAGGATVAATGSFTTTTAGINNGVTPGFGILQGPTNVANGDYATVGLYDYAATSGATPFNIVGGSSIAGFYSTVSTNGVNFDDVTAGTLSAGIGNIDYNSLRFNTNQAETLTTSTGVLTTRGILVTPNVGAFNTVVGGTTLLQPSRTNSGEIVVWQNNLQGLLTISAPIGNGKTGPGPVVFSGPGTTSLTGANSYFGATYLNDGFTEINANTALGTPSTGATLFLKGGTLVANGNFALDNNGANIRAITIGTSGNTQTVAAVATPLASGTSGPAGNGTGGGLAATTSNTLTVNGVITTTANAGSTIVPTLYIGTGVLPGTGGTSPNAAVSGNGTVTITPSEAYTGPTVVNDGTLNLTGSLTGSSLVTVNGVQTINGIAQTGGTLSGTGTITNGLVVNGGGAVSLAGANNTKALTAGSAGGITLGNNTTYAPGSYATLSFASGGASGFETLNTAGALTLNSSGAFVNITGVAAQGTFNLVNYASQAGTGTFSLDPTNAGVQTINSGRNTYTLINSTTAEKVQITGPASPGVAFFDGAVSQNFNDLSNATTTNFSADLAGTTTTANVPGGTTDVILTASTVTGANADTLGGVATTINSLNVNANAVSNTITDTASLTINGAADNNTSLNGVNFTGNAAGSGISIASGAGAFTIAAPLIVGGGGAAQSYTNNSANLFTTGSITGSAASGTTQTLTLVNTNTGATTVSGAVGDSGAGGKLALNINNSATAGTGVTTVGVPNTYSGGTTVSGGQLNISNGANLGTGATTLANGASIVSNYATGNRLTLNNLSGTGTVTGSQQTSINTLVTGGNLTLVSNFTGPTGLLPTGIAFIGDAPTYVGTLNLKTSNAAGVTTLGDFVEYYNGGLSTTANFTKTTFNLTNFARLVEFGPSTGGTTNIGAINGDATSVLAGAENGANAIDSIGALNTNSEFDGVIGGGSNSLAITKVGTGTFIIGNAANTYANGTNINAGAVQFNNVGGVPTTGALTINGGGSLLTGNTGNAFPTVTSALAIPTLTATSAGDIALTGDSSEAITVPAANVNIMLGAAVNSTYSGVLTPAGQTYHLGGGGATLTIANVLPDVNGTATNLIIGAAGSTGTVVLANANTYSGTTSIVGNGEKLRLANATGSGSATGTGALNLTPTAGTVANPNTVVLSGTGMSTGALTATGIGATGAVTAIALIAPGNNGTGTHGGVGTLTVGTDPTVGGATLNQAAFDYDLSSAGDTGTPNAANDQLDLNNGATPGGALSLGVLSFNFNAVNGTLDNTAGPTPGDVYTLISGASGVTTQAGFNTANITTTFSGVTAPGGYMATYNATANGLQVQFSPAPEPAQTATMGLIALGMGALFLRARKRRVSDKSAS